MSDAVMWIIPEAPAPQVAVAEGGRKVDSSGLRFGILDNSKSNADHLLQMIIDGVKASLPISSVVKLRKPSGNAAYDSAVERAINRAQPLPMPPDPALVKEFRELNLKFKAQE